MYFTLQFYFSCFLIRQETRSKMFPHQQSKSLYECTFYVLNMCPFSNSGENYRSQDKDYRQDFWYNSRGLRGQGQLRQGHSMPRRPLGMPNTGNTSWSSERHSTRGTPNSRARGRGTYTGSGRSSWTFWRQSSISTDRQTSDRDIYHQRQNKRTWGKNCNIIYTMLHKIDL